VAYIYLSKLIAHGKPQELKQLPEITPNGSSWFEISSSNATRLLPVVREHPHVLDATIFGEAIHALGRRGTDAQTLQTFLQQKGFATAQCRAVPPSLEDVFVTLTRQRRNSSEG
jgi:hypothetical protein